VKIRNGEARVRPLMLLEHRRQTSADIVAVLNLLSHERVEFAASKPGMLQRPTCRWLVALPLFGSARSFVHHLVMMRHQRAIGAPNFAVESKSPIRPPRLLDQASKAVFTLSGLGGRAEYTASLH
jgi:hypothetical protein